MYLSNSCYRYIKAPLNTSLITLLKFLLVLIKAGLLYLMLADLALHMPQLSFDIIINKHHYHMSKHFILASVPVIVSYLISIRENNLGVFY